MRTLCVTTRLVQEPTFPDLAVDLDFQQALQSGAVTL